MVQPPQQIQMKGSDDDLKGRYSNIMQISHTSEEFILDFFLAHPPTGQLVSRLILSPGHMKRMLVAMQENIARYEKNFGDLKAAEEPTGIIGFQSENNK